MAGNLDNIEHVVVLMLENRSFDHMLGWLYTSNDNLSPLGHPYEGLTGNESNRDSSGQEIKVFKINPGDPHAYFMPGVNPGEGYARTNAQLFGTQEAPLAPPQANESNIGFVRDFGQRVAAATQSHSSRAIPGTTPSAIMGCFAPEALPILSGLARGYAVCDRWFGSVPTETMPNRAFALAATSLGTLGDPQRGAPVPTYNTKSIFGALSDKGIRWTIYGCGIVYTKNNFPDTLQPGEYGTVGDITAFKDAARDGELPAFTFLEPAWSGPTQSDQHPVSDVSKGEQLIHDVYYGLYHGKNWSKTLLIVTYDEHGGCYDHVAPPWGSQIKPPTSDGQAGEFGFDFRRLGPRVPAVLISPLIAAGTVFRIAEDGNTLPLEHTAVLKTIEKRWGLAPLTDRDAAASDLGAVLTLGAPRTDDPLADVKMPNYDGPIVSRHTRRISKKCMPTRWKLERLAMPTERAMSCRR